MSAANDHFRSPPSAFRGVATLELVLTLPILLALVVGIVWLGNVVIAQADVTIDARHQSWLKRANPTGTALLFLKDDIVSADATEEVNVSPLFDDTAPPESSHDVMAAAWDAQQLPLNKVPNWKQYLVAAANAKTAGLQNGYVNASNQLASFKNSARNVWQTIASNMIRELTSLGDSVKSLLGNAESSESAEKQQQKDRIQRQLEAKEEELKQARQQLRELDSEASKTLRDVLQNRVDRLETEVSYLKDDLEAIDE